MLTKESIQQKSAVLWEIPASSRDDMRVPAQVYATEEVLDAILDDDSLNQLMNVSTLPGITKAAIAMPDAHQGYGFPIGGVAATEYPDGVISPGGIGYDINCGVRLLSTNMMYEDVKHRMGELSRRLYKRIPAGAGKSGLINLSHNKLDNVLENGAQWAVDKGRGKPADIEHSEAQGRMDFAGSDFVSHNAKQRGKNQLGTLGGGNHFLEIDRVSEIFDENAAKAMNLRKGQLVFFIHTGSRGLGHQIATDYVKTFQQNLGNYGVELPDRGLACAPMSTEDGESYYHAMGAGANFAFCNRQVMTSEIREAWQGLLGSKAGDVEVVYDIAHNIAKIEEHEINGETKKLIVHRKGATRAFGPGHPILPKRYKSIGQPVFIPGSMGTSSYVLTGTSEGMKSTFGSTCHGAGRSMSRTAAKKQVNAGELISRLNKDDIHVQAASKSGVAEEAPLAYKNVEIVVDTVEQAGLAKKAVKMKPVAVIKG